MSTLAVPILVLLALVMFHNFARGTLGLWFRAKFLNQTPDTAAVAAAVVKKAKGG